MLELNGNKMAEDTVELEPVNLVSPELSCSSICSQPELTLPPELLSSNAGQEKAQGGKCLASQVTLDESFLLSLEEEPVPQPSVRENAKKHKEEEEEEVLVAKEPTGLPSVAPLEEEPVPQPLVRKNAKKQKEEEEEVLVKKGTTGFPSVVPLQVQREQMLAERRVLGSPSIGQQSWGDCHLHVLLLREALQSSAPDIAVLGPLQGCLSFYMTHLHNEVLSSTYARTSIFGANGTPLESAFIWFGGWRPTSALVLVYSLMGIEIENALEAARLGKDIVKSDNSSLLSTRQLAVMHTLQRHTQQAEMKLSKKLDVLQMLTSDQDMLEAVLLDAASNVANDSSRFKRAVGKRMTRFRRLLVQAEELRLGTIKDLLSVLTPIQSARCGVAIFEICRSFRAMDHSGPPLPPPLTVTAVPPSLALPTITMLSAVALPERAGAVAHPVSVAGSVSTPLNSAASSFSPEMPASDDADPLGHAEGSPLHIPSCSDSVSSSIHVLSQPSPPPPYFVDNEQISSSEASTSAYFSSVTSPDLEMSILEPPVNNGNDVIDTEATGGKSRVALPESHNFAYGKSSK